MSAVNLCATTSSAIKVVNLGLTLGIFSFCGLAPLVVTSSPTKPRSKLGGAVFIKFTSSSAGLYFGIVTPIIV